jgi:hypothetical protein
MKKTVVSFADGSGNYAKALMRLEQSLRQVNFEGQFKGINDYGHIGSPHHKGSPGAVPYAFKALSIKKAIEEGADLILWCDSVVYATKSINPIFEYIEKSGVLLFDNIGYSIGDYTSDYCLDYYNMTREQAFNNKMIMACVMGFNIHNPTAKEFLDQYISASELGVSSPYNGDWSNNNLEVSNDMRVKGHRHDQSVASVLAEQMNIPIINAQSTFFAYESHKGIVPVSNNVCLWSGGI